MTWKHRRFHVTRSRFKALPKAKPRRTPGRPAGCSAAPAVRGRRAMAGGSGHSLFLHREALHVSRAQIGAHALAVFLGLQPGFLGLVIHGLETRDVLTAPFDAFVWRHTRSPVPQRAR